MRASAASSGSKPRPLRRFDKTLPTGARNLPCTRHSGAGQGTFGRPAPWGYRPSTAPSRAASVPPSSSPSPAGTSPAWPTTIRRRTFGRCCCRFCLFTPQVVSITRQQLQTRNPNHPSAWHYARVALNALLEPPAAQVIQRAPAFKSLHQNKSSNLKAAALFWSGKRDSNSRPRPWQGRALPTELFPQCCYEHFPVWDYKGTSFF